ncbi:MAG: hypothetical protein JSV49_09330 [Thermoplasmata archaeon]|nr:MAG: hypothetical protein JSV49_09330 [Thermoplasmata archaeon]
MFENEVNQNLIVSLVGILTIDVILLLALFAQVEPHPPGFLGPFIGAMITLGIISVVLALWERKIGLLAAGIFGCVNILAVGPQKFFFDPNGEAVVPIIIIGTILIVALFYSIMLVGKKDVSPASPN